MTLAVPEELTNRLETATVAGSLLVHRAVSELVVPIAFQGGLGDGSSLLASRLA